GDEAFRAEVAALFVESSQRLETDLGHAVRAGGCKRIGEIAHALKGSAAAVGATLVPALAPEMGNLRREGESDQLAPLVISLVRELARAREYLDSQPSANAT